VLLHVNTYDSDSEQEHDPLQAKAAAKLFATDLEIVTIMERRAQANITYRSLLPSLQESGKKN
jgi:acyl CoA:acetate/3-ketoacid CoA transferase alpha subunit